MSNVHVLVQEVGKLLFHLPVSYCPCPSPKDVNVISSTRVMHVSRPVK